MTRTTARGNVETVDDYLVAFGARVSKLAKERGINHKQLALLLDCHANTVNNLVSGRTEVGVKTLAKLCIVFQVSADELLGFR